MSLSTHFKNKFYTNRFFDIKAIETTPLDTHLWIPIEACKESFTTGLREWFLFNDALDLPKPSVRLLLKNSVNAHITGFMRGRGGCGIRTKKGEFAAGFVKAYAMKEEDMINFSHFCKLYRVLHFGYATEAAMKLHYETDVRKIMEYTNANINEGKFSVAFLYSRDGDPVVSEYLPAILSDVTMLCYKSGWDTVQKAKQH